jgi:hypothetical protein
MEEREYWLSLADRLSRRVLPALAKGELKRTMPCEGLPERAAFTCLEAEGRLLLGLAPWLELEAALPAEEAALRRRVRDWALEGLAHAVDPASPDRMNFDQGAQPLVDAALLAAALLRAPKSLLGALPARTRAQLADALRSTRKIEPFWNNWLLFSALIEVALAHLGCEWLEAPISTALRLHEDWYKGDGTYGDGPLLVQDYYNSFMIHPLLIETLDGIRPFNRRWDDAYARILERARRYAEVQERVISPEGTFPPLGRSLCYRIGVFHHLAFMAWRRLLPETLQAPAVRCALGAVLRRQMELPGTFDRDGWLTLGYAGHQPELAEHYVSTGSVYFAATALAPLGLAPEDHFWSGPDQAWTSKRLWAGYDGARDRKLEAH